MIIALLVDVGLPENPINDLARHTANAITRAAAGQGHRLLIHVDTGTLTPVVLAAAEYLTPVGVEGDEVETARLVLLPLIRDDNTVEDSLTRLFEDSEDESRDNQSNSLLALFSDMGVADTSLVNNASTREEFARLFAEWRPSAFIVLGATHRLEPALLGAASYRQDYPNVPLYYTSATDQREQGGGWGEAWQELESLLGDAEIDVRSALDVVETIEDEQLLSIAREAEIEANLALASERLFIS